MNHPSTKFLLDTLDLNDKLRIVDIGANPIGPKTPYRPLLDMGLCHVTGFEPQEAAFEKLQAKKGPDETYFQAAIGDGGTHTLHLYRASGLTSLFPLQKNLTDFLAIKGTKHLQDIPFKTQKLDDIQGIGRVDMLKIDIQGAEVAALENARRTLSDTMVIQTEMRLSELYEGEPGFGTLHETLKSSGFELHKFVSFHPKPIRNRSNLNVRQHSSQLVDGDVVYIRSLRALEGENSAKIKRLAILAQLVFHSYDLVVACLDILAHRSGVPANSAERYLELR